MVLTIMMNIIIRSILGLAVIYVLFFNFDPRRLSICWRSHGLTQYGRPSSPL